MLELTVLNLIELRVYFNNMVLLVMATFPNKRFGDGLHFREDVIDYPDGSLVILASVGNEISLNEVGNCGHISFILIMQIIIGNIQI